MYATRSQTEEAAKLEYTAYSAQQPQHLSQPSAAAYLTESDFGGHAKEESTLFSVASQPPQHSQAPPSQQQPPPQQQQQQQTQQQAQQVEQAEEQQQQQQQGSLPTLADYNQSTSKGHEILSQVNIF